MKKKGPPECHPDKPYFSKGLCRSCYQKQIEWPKKRDKANEQRKNSYYLAKFGLTTEQAQQLYTAFSICSICGKPSSQIDHSHRTNEIRGVLCFPCNVFLGRLEKNLAMLPKYLNYLGVPNKIELTKEQL